MLTYEDCLGLCELTEEEIEAIALHEHIPHMVAIELAQYLIELPDGTQVIKRIIIDDINQAELQNNLERYLCLKSALKHFVDTHPDNPDNN